jgi:acetolactate synthase-1/2/3 large subunit
MAPRSGGELLVAALRINGVDRVFCVPGESYIAALDALYDVPSIAVVTTRHEVGAANMAEADGKMTGRPGVAMVTRGPGATHASTGVHTAMQDSTPMLLFVGQVARGMRGREAFQEIDYAQMFGSVAKWATEIDDARRIPELVTRAFRVAMSGRPGPVVLALPEDMLRDRVDVPDLGPAVAAGAHPGDDDLARMRELLGGARRPLMLLGGSGWDAPAVDAIRRFAQRVGLPTACTFRRQALFDARDEHYVGDVGVGVNPALAQRVRDADLILAIGGRLGEAVTSGYTLIESPRPKQRLIHVHADPNELGRVYEADLAINAVPKFFARALDTLEPVDGAPWREWLLAARSDYTQSLAPSFEPARLDLAAIVRFLSERLPDDAMLCNGAGNFAAWLHRFFQYKAFGTQLGSTAGAMAYGIPAAIAAKLRYPKRIVVAWAGDGDFMMSGHELATAMQYGAPIVVIVINNGMLATIRMHQERAYPGRPIATDLRNPDFVALARAYGAHAALVERTEEFAPAFERALESGLPALLELRVDPEIISTRTTIGAIRAAALARGPG